MTFTQEEIEQNRKDWIAALRGNEFKQCQDKLEIPGVGNCCLGVLCRVLDKKYPGMIEIVEGPDKTLFNGADTHVPSKIRNAVGLRTISGSYGPGRHLSDDNDIERKTFAQIADIIEAKPSGLFVEDSK